MAMQFNLRKISSLLFQSQFLNGQVQCLSTTATCLKQKKIIAPVKTRQLTDVGQSLATKGFLRSIKAYVAPADAADKVKAICNALLIPVNNQHKLNETEKKFRFLEACFKDFKHSIPNSQVHEINTVGDVIKFYQTSVNITVPYDALKNMDLPENLHIQYDYVRFHPDTDTKFNGQTAFPKSSTLVTGLKYREKYAGFEAKRSWP